MKRVGWLLPAGLAIAFLAVLLALGGLLLVSRDQGQNLFVDTDQPVPGPGDGLVLELGKPVGQTFVARHGGLAGIEFYLLSATSTPTTLTLHLYAEPLATVEPSGLGPLKPGVATASLQLPPQTQSGFYRFTFPPLPGSHGQYYYAILDASAAEETAIGSDKPAAGVEVALSDGALYLDGAAYQNHRPLDAQTAFRLVYAPAGVLRDLLKTLAGWLGLLASAGLLFVVPGLALLAWLLPGRGSASGRPTWAGGLALAAGVSVALYPLLILWTDLIGLHLGRLYAWLPPIIGLVALAWRYRAWRPWRGWESLRAWAGSEALWPDLALLALLSMVLGVRLLVVRTLEAPMWGDSFQHTLVAQLLVDHAGLFDSWAPYAELTSFTYHFGFQSASAALHWLMGLPVPQATLWTGQVLNVLAVLAVYPLALRVSGSRWGATWAVLFAGLLSPLPMSYTNWGRYTQLAGQVILPAAMWLTWEVVERPGRRRGLVALAAIVAGGLALTHYRVLLFYVVFVLALLLAHPGHGRRREALLRLLGIGVGAGLLFLPWLVHNLDGVNLQMLGILATRAPSQSQATTWDYNAIGRLDAYLAPLWWLALVLGLGLGLWQRRRGVLLMAIWWLLLLLATNPDWLSLPGTGVITNFALFILVYLPAGLFSGVLAAYATRRAGRKRWISVIVALVIAGLGMWGFLERMGDLDPARHALVTRPDVRAAAWIRSNVPAGARFLANSFPAYGGSSVVGSDGGWWLPLLAGRQSTVPPLNYSSEDGPDPGYRLRVNELSRQVREFGPDDEAVLALLQEEGVTHVYIGQRQGRVNYAGSDVLDPNELLDSPNYRLRYHQDRVWIFELNP